MSENRPSIQRVIDAWAERFDNRFPAATRKEAVVELVLDLVAQGYDRSAIERAKLLAMEEMVGPRSKYGSQGHKDWKKNAAKDYDRAVRQVFEPLEERTGPVDVPFTPSTISDEERAAIEQQEIQALKEFNEELATPPEHVDKEEVESSDITNEGLIYDNTPVIRPEMDRSRFANVKTTEILSDEDYFALLERENNEW